MELSAPIKKRTQLSSIRREARARRSSDSSEYGMYSKWYSEISLHGKKRASCSKSAAGLLPGSHQTDIRMCSRRLLRLCDGKSTASQFVTWHHDFMYVAMLVLCTQVKVMFVVLVRVTPHFCSHQADIRVRSHYLPGFITSLLQVVNRLDAS